MRKPLIAGNWKMHGDSAFVARYAATLGEAERIQRVIELSACQNRSNSRA